MNHATTTQINPDAPIPVLRAQPDFTRKLPKPGVKLSEQNIPTVPLAQVEYARTIWRAMSCRVSRA